MSAVSSELISGRKTFFVAPELTILPEESLKFFYQLGYETHCLNDDFILPLRDKVKLLAEMFPELILFFNVDRRVSGISWPKFIEEIQHEYGDRAVIGVQYNKRSDINEIRDIERRYLFDIGISGGCVPIEYQKSRNLDLLTKVLAANQANGRRRHLRAVCNEACKLTISHRGRTWKGHLRDVSVSHFSVTFTGEIPDIPLYEKIEKIQLFLRGVMCNVTGVLCLKRVVGRDNIHVFVFRTASDREGLDPEQLERVNNYVYSTCNEKVSNLLRDGFTAARNGLVVPGNTELAG